MQRGSKNGGCSVSWPEVIKAYQIRMLIVLLAREVFFCFSLCLRHRWKTVPEAYCMWVCPSVSVCVSLCVPKTLWSPYLKQPMNGISPNFGRRCIWVCRCDDWLLGSKGQGHSRQLSQNLVNTISQKPVKRISPNFGHRCFWVHGCDFGTKRSKVNVTADNDLGLGHTDWV